MAPLTPASRAGSVECRPRRGLRRTAMCIGMLVWLGVAASAGTRPIHGDAALMCASANSLTQTGSLALPQPMRDDVITAPDGRIYTNYGILAILQCVPAQGLRHLGRWWTGEEGGVTFLLIGACPAAVAALLAVGFFFLAVALRVSRPLAAFASIALIFTTPHWAYGRLLYSENLQAAVLTWTAVVWLPQLRSMSAARLLAGGVMLSLCVHAKTPLALMLFAVLAYQLSMRPSLRYALRGVAWTTLGGLPLLCVFLWYNHIRLGDALSLGYDTARAKTIGFGTPLPAGLHGFLFSPGKSIFVYAPFLVLAIPGLRRLWRSAPALFWLLVFPTGALMCLFAKWWSWSGDWGWGPRLILPLFPFMFAVALFAIRRRTPWRWLAAPLLALGLVVNTLGVSVDDSHYLAVVHRTLHRSLFTGPTMAPIRDDLAPLHFIPEFSPPLGHYWLLKQHLSGDWSETDWFPWKSIGIPAWNVRTDPRPPEGLNHWFDGSVTAYWTAAGLGASLLVLLLTLLWTLSAGTPKGRAERTTPPEKPGKKAQHDT